MHPEGKGFVRQDFGNSTKRFARIEKGSVSVFEAFSLHSFYERETTDWGVFSVCPHIPCNAR
jgi:hypothetical protein